MSRRKCSIQLSPSLVFNTIDIFNWERLYYHLSCNILNRYSISRVLKSALDNFESMSERDTHDFIKNLYSWFDTLCFSNEDHQSNENTLQFYRYYKIHLIIKISDAYGASLNPENNTNSALMFMSVCIRVRS